ncbi:MAG: hypothetical protein E7632_01885 [Ruminococcaceae bacterium]|nr:hypothetical protein [Oscillospiraceae bacterium]
MLNDLLFAAKRAVRTVIFPVLLILLAASLILAPMLGREESLPPAGIVCADESVIAHRMLRHLTENGFELCPDEATLRARVAAGEYDCGAVIPDGFEALVLSNTPDGAARFITSPTSFAPTVYQNHLAAAIFSELAPVITADALADSGISLEETLAEYRAMMDAGMVFTFELVRADASAPLSADDRGKAYLLGAASLLIFTILMYGICGSLRDDIRALSMRIGRKTVLLRAVIPDMAIRAGGILMAVFLAAGVSFVMGDSLPGRILLPLGLFTLAVTVFAFLAAAVLRTPARVQILTFFILLASVALCPIYLDVTLIAPWLGWIRAALPPYWLWVFAG